MPLLPADLRALPGRAIVVAVPLLAAGAVSWLLLAPRSAARTAAADVPAADHVEFYDLGAIGGAFQAVAPLAAPSEEPAARRIVVGMGNRLALVDVTIPQQPSLLELSRPLTDTISDLLLAGGKVWVAAGASGLYALDPHAGTLDPGPPLPIPGSVRRLATDDTQLVAATSKGAVLLPFDDPTQGRLIATGPVTDVAIARLTAYALQDAGVRVVDIARPAEPKTGKTIRIGGGGQALAADRTRLFVADGDSPLKVYDLDNPRNPRKRGALDAAYTVADIALVGAFAYLGTTDAGMRTVDVRADPMEFRFGGGGAAGGVDALATDGFNLYSAGASGLAVYDLRFGYRPQPVGTLPTVDDALSLLLHEDTLVAGSYGSVAFVNVANLAEPRVLSALAMSYPEAMLHLDGPGSPGEGAPADIYLVADGGALHVLDAADPRAPRRLSAVNVGGFQRQGELVTDLEQSGNVVYAANGRYGGITAVDVTSPTLPVPGGFFTTTGFATELGLVGPSGLAPTLVVAGDSQRGLVAADITTPLTPTLVSATGGTWYPYDVAASGDLVVVAAAEDGMLVYRVNAEPGSPDFGHFTRVAAYWPGMSARTVVIDGELAFLGGAEGSACRVVAVALADPQDPREIGCWTASGAVDALAVDGDRMAVTGLGLGVNLVRLERPLPPTPAPTVTATAPPPKPSATPTRGPSGRAAWLPLLRVPDR